MVRLSEVTTDTPALPGDGLRERVVAQMREALGEDLLDSLPPDPMGACMMVEDPGDDPPLGGAFTGDDPNAYDVNDVVAAELARMTRQPVKLMLDRAEEVTVGGTRPPALRNRRRASCMRATGPKPKPKKPT